MPTASDDLYAILQISPKAEPEIVRAAYKRLIQKYHPDKVLDGNLEADECVKKISYAYSILKDPGRRATYDLKAGYRDPEQPEGHSQPQERHQSKESPNANQRGPEPRRPSSQPNPQGQGTHTKKDTKVRSGWIAQSKGFENRKIKKTTVENWVGPVTGAPNLDGWEITRVQARQRMTAKVMNLPVFFRPRMYAGPDGPVMTVIPSGSFTMGSPSGFLGLGGEKERQAHEGPQHRVSIAQPFAIGRFAVTFEEFDLFCRATDRALPDDEGWGRGNLPVININWFDAKAYCEWLSSQTGKIFRLPSESEWEYACRGGAITPFWWGGDVSPHRANYNGHHVYNRGDRGRHLGHSVAVGEHAPNPFGLFQVSGNVWEWCQDNWHKNYKKAPSDGSAWLDASDDDSERVVRGGSHASAPGWLRSAFRSHCPAEERFDDQGFRIALTLPPIQT